MIRVLVADDHAIVRAGLERLLHGEGDIEVVASVGDGESAVASAITCRPDVVLMDLAMGGMDGMAATARIREASPGANVVVFTGCAESGCVLEAIDAGAVGYLLKDAEPDELLRGIRAAARGDAPFAARAARALIARPGGFQAANELTGRELEILVLAADGLVNKQIARRLGITERTVKGHLTVTFQRLGVVSRSQAVLWAERQGLLGHHSRP